MAKKLVILLFACILLSGFMSGVFVFGKKNQSLPTKDNHAQSLTANQKLVLQIEEYIRQAKYHHQGLYELLDMARNVKHNREVIKRAAYCVSQIGFHTLPVMEIARLAYKANREVKYLNDILAISITYKSESATIVNLARKAVYRQISDAELEQKISYYRNHSQWKTIEEVIEHEENQ